MSTIIKYANWPQTVLQKKRKKKKEDFIVSLIESQLEWIFYINNADNSLTFT